MSESKEHIPDGIQNDLTSYLEIALVFLQRDPQSVGVALDISDEEVDRLHNQLEKYMNQR